MNENNKNLDSIINKVDYKKYEKGYVPSTFAINFVNFIKLANDNKVENRTPLFHYDILDTIKNSRNTLIVSFRGSAKALPLDSIIYSPDGPIKMKDVKIGDKIFSGRGLCCKVTDTSPVYYKLMYRIVLDDGYSFETSFDHRNVVYEVNSFGTMSRKVYSTGQIIGRMKKGRTFYIPVSNKPIEFNGTLDGITTFNYRKIAREIVKGNDTIDRFLYVKTKYRRELFKCLYKYNSKIVGCKKCLTIRDKKDNVDKIRQFIQDMGYRTWVERDKENRYARILYRNGYDRLLNKYKKFANEIDSNTWNMIKFQDKWFKIDKAYNTLKYKECKCIAVNSAGKTYMMKNSIMTHNTTLTAEYMILYLAVYGSLEGFGNVNVGMYIGDTMENGVKNLRNNLEHRYNNSNFLQKFLPKVKFTDPEWEFQNIDGHCLTFRGFGANSGVRGFKKYGDRPQIAILDDLMSDKSAESKTITKDIENIIYKAVRQAMHPTRRKVVWIGTPFNKNDPLYKAAGTSAWTTKAFPICHQFPCTEDDFVGAWEDRFPYQSVKEEYLMLKENGKIDAFNQELMLRILSDEDRLVLDEDIVWYDRTEFKKSLSLYNVYITTDFATSETQNSDFSVISVWALDYKGVFHWVDGIVKRQNMSKNIDDLFRFAELYKPLSTGIEISGQQKGFISWIKKEMTDRKFFFTLASDKASGEEGLRPNTSKLTRFNVVLPLFKQRKIAFPEDLRESASMLEFIDELTSATPSGFKSVHDDCVDTVSQLAMLEYFTPVDPRLIKRVENIKDSSYMNNYYFNDRDDDSNNAISSYIV